LNKEAIIKVFVKAKKKKVLIFLFGFSSCCKQSSSF